MDAKPTQDNGYEGNIEDTERGRVQSKRFTPVTTFLAIFTLAFVLFAGPTHVLNCFLNLCDGAKHKALPLPWLDAFTSLKALNGIRAEEIFVSVPNPEDASFTARRFSRRPHVAGSTQDFDTALDVLRIFQKELSVDVPAVNPVFAAGSDASRRSTLSISTLESDKPRAWVDTYYPTLNHPVDSALEIIGRDGQVIWVADLFERVESEEDPDAAAYASRLPAYHGYSHSGDVVSKLVFANYGTKKDYDDLLNNGVDVNGSLVLVKYGYTFRGMKVKEAEERGAIGCLIYNDPEYDGGVTVENGYAAYPQGPARNPDSIERGSVQTLPLYPGDPWTPGYPSYKNATRSKATSLPGIPSLPISWNNARRLLREIEKGETIVRLFNQMKFEVTPIWNTMAVIPGHIKDEVIILGNHRDAWGMGATDPVSGTAALVEIVRGLGVLHKRGWKPVRTIVIASWDAEEYGLIGSTEWGEDFADWIKKHVVAYVNVDAASSGSRFAVSGSTALGHMLVGIAQQIPHPTEPGRTLWDARLDTGPYRGSMTKGMRYNASLFAATRSLDTLRVGDLGSGSDFTVFFHHLGVSSIFGDFRKTIGDPVKPYHSVFDTFLWQQRYGDPGLKRTVAVAKFLGLQIIRLADALILPFNTTQYTHHLDWYIDKVEVSSQKSGICFDFSSLRESVEELRNASLTLDLHKEEEEKKLVSLLGEWDSSRRRLTRLFSGILGSSQSHDSNQLDKILRSAGRVQEINGKLFRFERGFISEDGMEGRTWYRHMGVAPDRHSGYAAMSFPGLTEALVQDRNLTRANYENARLRSLMHEQALALGS